MSEVIFSERAIKERVWELACEISNRFRGQDVILVGLLNGGVVLVVDLARNLEKLAAIHSGVKECYIDFMRVSSYGDAQESTGRVSVEMDVQSSPAGKHVIIVDDVGDTLNTLNFVRQHMLAKHPASVSTCVMVAKPDRFKRDDLVLDFVGFSQPGLPFLVGYGMDDRGTKRGLPYIGTCPSS